MKYLAVLVVSALSVILAGCFTLSPTTEANLKKSAEQICQTSLQLEQSYVVLRDAGSLSASVVAKGDKAFAAMRSFCASSQNWDASNAAMHAALLYVQITTIMKDME